MAGGPIGRRDLPARGCRRRGSGGFTIVEVLVAMGILSVGLLGAAQMQAHSMRYNSMGRDTLAAITSAQCAMERILATPFNQIVQSNFPVTEVGTDCSSPQYRRQVVTITPGAGMTNVQVTVFYGGTPGRSYTIQTTVSPQGQLEPGS